MSNDIVRWMDEHRLTTCTIGGHGFGAKVATATAINNMNRFTGVINLEGGPLDHRYYQAYQELASYIEAARNMNLATLNATDAVKKLYDLIPDPKWRSIFIQNIVTEKGAL
jgi:pimeloyl-ACP methyl ester carboxylesterase